MIKRKVFCNGCQNETWHEILHEEVKDCSQNSYRDINTYYLVKCCGCDDIRLQIIEVSDACERNDDGNVIPIEYVFPPKEFRPKPAWISKIAWPYHVDTGFENENILFLIAEIYSALYNKSTRLAMMGIRALLEHVMIKKCGDHKSFKGNIEAFRNGGYISDVQKQALEAVLESGHAVMHRSHEPSDSELLAALDITENLVQSIYIIDRAKEESLKNVPKRR